MKIKEWQKGNESELTPLQRIELMNEWLKSIKEYILSKPEIENKEEIFLGGFED